VLLIAVISLEYLNMGRIGRCSNEGCSATRPFGFAQGHESFDLTQERESFDFAQDRELVERPVEWKVDFLRSHQE